MITSSAAAGFPPVLVEDINSVPQNVGTYSRGFVELGGEHYFFTDDGISGSELWKTDGTESGTVMVVDICPGACGSIFQGRIVNLDGTLIFGASDGFVGGELWASDGTANGTRMIKDIVPGPDSSQPWELVRSGSLVFFQARDYGEDGTGTELWVTDGTTSGTTLVKDICPGLCSFSDGDAYLTDLDGILMFRADDGTDGAELWTSDGTELGTVQVMDINPNSGNSNPYTFYNFGGTLFFVADDGTNGREIWISDGTEGGTTRVTTFSTSFSINQFFDLDGMLLFGGNGDSGGSELWTTDGTAVGTTKIKEIRSGTLSSYPNYFAKSEAGVAIFSANDGTGSKIWRTDGTPGGTIKIAAPSHSSPWDIIFVTGGGVAFTATSGSGRETWFSDGTGGGTLQLADLCPGSCSSTFNGQNLTGVDGTIFINAEDGTHGRAELFTTDGTPGGTVLIRDIQRVANESAEPFQITPVSMPPEGGADVVFFRANDGASTSGIGGGRELWSSDGTPGGTYMVADIRPGQHGSQPYAMIPLGSLIYFTAWDPTWGREIWKTDGTDIGTERVADICPGDCDALWEEVPLTEMGGMLYFPGNDDVNGTELWKSDGTGPGTSMVKDIGPTSNGGYPSGLTVVGGTLFFSAYTFDVPPEGGGAPYGTELWKSDGTDAGTELVKDICPGACSAVGGDSPADGGGGGTPGGPQYTDLEGLLVFSANDGSTGAELWRSDGTESGTVLVQDTAAGTVGSNPLQLTAVGATLFYQADDGTSGTELWMSDGTDGGTAMVKDIIVGGGGSIPSELTAIGDRLVFTADDGANGRELWVSDGTPDGTQMVVDICSGACGSTPNFVAAEGRVVYFAADDGSTGREVWVSDGTAAGTVRIADIETSAPSHPEQFTASGTRIFFTARRPSDGEELWVLEREVDLGLTVSDAPDPALTGPLVYNITVTSNAGSSVATNVTVIDTLPPEVSYVGSSGDGVCDETGGVVTCHLGVMIDGEVNMLDIEVDIPAGVSGTLVNSASVTSSALETNPSDNQDAETTKAYDAAELIFYDNFESGDTTAWSETT